MKGPKKKKHKKNPTHQRKQNKNPTNPKNLTQQETIKLGKQKKKTSLKSFNKSMLE